MFEIGFKSLCYRHFRSKIIALINQNHCDNMNEDTNMNKKVNLYQKSIKIDRTRSNLIEFSIQINVFEINWLFRSFNWYFWSFNWLFQSLNPLWSIIWSKLDWNRWTLIKIILKLRSSTWICRWNQNYIIIVIQIWNPNWKSEFESTPITSSNNFVGGWWANNFLCFKGIFNSWINKLGTVHISKVT